MTRKTTPDVIDIEGLIPLDRLQSQQSTLAVIDTAEEAQAAGLFLRAVRHAIRNIKREYRKVRKPVNEALKDLTRQEQERLAPYLAAERSVDAPLLAWQIADRERVERERKEQLEQARRDEEAKRQVEVAELKARASRARGMEKAVFKAQAKVLEAAPILPTVTAIVPEATKIDGVSLREYWHAEVFDLALLVDAVASGKVPLAALQPNQEWLDDRAASLGNELAYPGVVAIKTHGQTARGV